MLNSLENNTERQWEKYRGQWGGKIENAEEMWWSEPQERLRSHWWARFKFRMDVRHHFILQFWRRFLRQYPDKKNVALDFGCGTGGTTLNFSLFLGLPMVGLDIFETQLGIARQFARRLNSPCRFERIGEDGKIPFADQTVDVIMSLDVLGHVSDIPSTLAEFQRVLKPGGAVILLTESDFSPEDRSLMHYLAHQGLNMMTQVPEHISLFPRERLEAMFNAAGLRVRKRYSANVGHFFFYPKDYVLLLKNKAGARRIYWLANAWNRISKIFPFYPLPFDGLRLLLTRLRGEEAYGTSYYYYLEKI